MKRAHEGIAGFADQRVEYRRRLSLDDLLHDVVDRGLAELQQAFGKNAAAGAGDDFANDPVGFPGPDIVGSGAEHVAGDIFQHVPHQRHDVLVGRGADIDNVVAAFESLVSRRVPEQSFGALDDGNDLLARRRGVAADDVVDMLLANELVACGVIGGDDAAGIAQMRREYEIERIALIDFVDRHQRALAHLARHHGVGARLGKHEAERDGRLFHLGPGCCAATISPQEARSVTSYRRTADARHLGSPRLKKVPASH